MFPPEEAPRHREDLARAAQLARDLGAPTVLEDAHVTWGPGQVELARRAHERMAAGELVQPEEAFGGPLHVYRDRNQNVEARPVRGGLADGAPGPEVSPDVAKASEATLPSTPAGGTAPGRPAREGEADDVKAAASAGRRPSRALGAPAPVTGPPTPGTPGAGAGTDATPRARPTARRTEPRIEQGLRAARERRRPPDARAHVAHHEARRWWRAAALEQAGRA